MEKGALPRRQMLESQAKLERAKAELAKAKSLPQVVQAESEVKRAEVDLPLRELRDSQSRVAEAQSQLKRAETRRDVLEAQAQLKRAKSDVVVAQSQLKLSNTTYQTRLEQLGSTANAKGLVTVIAPISGTVASREVSIGQSLQDAGGKLMTIINDGRIFATANIYEKDLGIVKNGQKILIAAGGGSVITAIAFSTSNLLSRRKGSHLVTVGPYGEEIVTYETDTQIYLDNHKQTNVSPTPISIEKQENS